MNRKMIFYMTGQLVKVEALLLLLPLAVSLIYRERCAVPFLITIAIALVIGFALSAFCRSQNRVIYAKEGFVIVAFCWVILSMIGALPFYISREIPSYIDAFFETVSGFTTTGASILTDVESMSRGLLFWRSFTHWIGGMGVLVFIVALIPAVSDRSIHILRAEMPGPTVDKLVPRAKDTAKILYLIYIVMTALEIALLCAGGMNLFESIVHAFGTAGTGGFGVKADSIASYSPYLQWVIGVFMLLFGVNFNLYYLLLIRRFRAFWKSEELWAYLGIAAAAVGVITINLMSVYGRFSDALRDSFFQVSSIMTTTGYATADFDLWPNGSRAILLLLMFIGACAGSTGGGLKISRLVLLFKMIKREFRHMLHPRSVGVIQFEGRKINDHTLTNVAVYFVLYVLIMVVLFLYLCLTEPFDLTTNLSAAAACFNNIGPGLGAVGPTCSYAAYSGLSKIVLSVAMLLGRLELFPLLFAFAPSVWFKKK